jgi:transposase-like protein|tara:strand:+ start:298 stop:735 length:438 start_codon:yes stop_codon:yes gene_type:complete
VAKKSKYETIWTDIMSRRVEALFDQGGSIIEVSRLIGISRSTFYAWLNGTDTLKKPFREVVSIGKEAAEAWWMRQGRENIENRSFNNSLYQFNMLNRWNWNSNKKEEKKEIEYKGTVEVKKAVDWEAVVEKQKAQAMEDVAKSIH